MTKNNSLVASLASVFVIFAAMMSPIVALLIAFFALLYLALKNLGNAKGIVKTASLAFIIAASVSFGWTALRDITMGNESSNVLSCLTSKKSQALRQ